MTLAMAIQHAAAAQGRDVILALAEASMALAGARGAIVLAHCGHGREVRAVGVDAPLDATLTPVGIAELYTDAAVEPFAAGGCEGFIAVIGATWPRATVADLAGLAAHAGLAVAHVQLQRESFSTRTVYRTLVEQIPAVTYYRALDLPGVPSFVSPQIERLIGFTAAEVDADPDIWRKRIHPDDIERVLDEQRHYRPELQTTPLRAEYRLLHRDGHAVWVENYALAVRDEEGCATFVVGLLYDVSERKLLEDQLRHAQKMEAIGKLAGGVAHDFNNLLSVVLSYGARVVAELGESDPKRAEVREIVRAGERAKRLTQQLLAFSQRQMLAPKVVDLGQTIMQMQPLLRRIVGDHATLDVRVAPHATHHVKADPTQLEQVVMNLVSNARDATPRGGRVTLEIGDARIAPDEALADVRLRKLVAAGRVLRLLVCDEGSGMTEATFARIFEPFFTTKAPHTNSGLGLPTALGIIEQSGGTMRARTKLGAGSTFEVLLPACAEEKAELPPRVPSSLKRGTETVLLAEDDDQVRRLVRSLLERLGYTVLESEHGDAAIAVAEQHVGAIHLLLTDVVMPHLNGYQLAQKMNELRPTTRVVFMSGYNEEAVTRHGIPRDAVILQKPFSATELANRLRAALDIEEHV